MSAVPKTLGTHPETSEPVSHELQRLRAALLAQGQLAAKNDELARQINAVNKAAAASSAATGTAQSLRQERQQILERQLQSGAVDHSDAELVAIEAKLTDAELNESRAASVADAQQTLLAGLEQQRTALREPMATLEREISEARFDNATADIRDEIADFRAATVVYARAWARLCGAGIAHCGMAARLRQLGVSAQGLGVENPERLVRFAPMGFGLADGGGYNQVQIDAGPSMDAAAFEFSERWRSAR